MAKCRVVYQEGNKGLKDNEDKEERLMLLESWKEFEVIVVQGLIYAWHTE